VRIIQNGPLIPTSVPIHTSTRSSQSGHAKLRWIRRRWKPMLCPSRSDAPVSTKNTPKADQLAKDGASTSEITIMLPFHIE
jgi:hypothetical protein